MSRPQEEIAKGKDDAALVVEYLQSLPGGARHELVLAAARRWQEAQKGDAVRCETTQTLRYPVKCACGSVESGIGPCASWLTGANPERCVYCDHVEECHHAVARWLEEKLYTHPAESEAVRDAERYQMWKELSLIDEDPYLFNGKWHYLDAEYETADDAIDEAIRARGGE